MWRKNFFTSVGILGRRIWYGQMRIILGYGSGLDVVMLAGSMPARASKMLALPNLPWSSASRKIRKDNPKGNASMLLAKAGMLPDFKSPVNSHSNFMTLTAFLSI